MFRSKIDHHQGDKIFVLTSVTKFNFIDVAIKINNIKFSK